MTDNVVMVPNADISQGYSEKKELGDGKTVVYEHQVNVSSLYILLLCFYMSAKSSNAINLCSTIYQRTRRLESIM